MIIAKSRKYIPTSFQGSFDNVIEKTDGTRHVDWLDILLSCIHTIVVPYIEDAATKKALLSLVKGCALSLQWNLTEHMLNEIQSHFEHWLKYLARQVDQKKLSRSVFRPVQHYLTHIPFIIRRQGPLRAYSTRSMERTIGVFSKLIKSKRSGGKKASNLIERLGLQSYISSVLDIEMLINLIKPATYSTNSYMNHPEDRNGPQLWEPFSMVTINADSVIEGVSGGRLVKAIKRYYLRSNSAAGSVDFNNLKITLASRLWMNSTIFSSSRYRQFRNETSRGNHHVFFSALDNRQRERWFVGTVLFYFKHVLPDSSIQFLAFVRVMKQHSTASFDSSIPIVKRNIPVLEQRGETITQEKYAVINIYDITLQVGLIQCPNNAHQFFVIAPYFVFNSNLRASAGNISLI
ncbi:hypothetical protein HPULCUR_010338 [Helicostylum pulchrum]|uniref:Uncharacterized protein n=1 Tax=Helicostylum pulchrum TaxID=562976 RepID=A0ABP9YDX3_9FUNG